MDRLRPYTVLNARQRRSDKLRRRLEGAGIALAACAVAVLLGRSPVTDVETSAAISNEARSLATAPSAPAPCWEQLPMRVALTQENIDRLCIKPLPAAARPSLLQPTPKR